MTDDGGWAALAGGEPLDDAQPPGRVCNGGPEGPWCGAAAHYVAQDADGMEWFACSAAHAPGAVRLLPAARWFEDLRTAVAAHEAAEILRAMAAEDRAAGA